MDLYDYTLEGKLGAEQQLILLQLFFRFQLVSSLLVQKLVWLSLAPSWCIIYSFCFVCCCYFFPDQIYRLWNRTVYCLPFGIRWSKFWEIFTEKSLRFAETDLEINFPIFVSSLMNKNRKTLPQIRRMKNKSFKRWCKFLYPQFQYYSAHSICTKRQSNTIRNINDVNRYRRCNSTGRWFVLQNKRNNAAQWNITHKIYYVQQAFNQNKT